MKTIINRKFSFLLAIFLFVGTIAYASSYFSCSNGDCTTSVHQHEDNWTMLISCEDGSSWSGGGSGSWEGSACN